MVGDKTALTGLTTNASGGTQFNMNPATAMAGHGGVNVGANGVSVTGPVFFDAPGTSAHPTVMATGAQTYNGAATLQAATMLLGTGGQDITFGSTVDGTFGLSASTAGNEFFKGSVGATDNLLSLTTDADPLYRGGNAYFGVAGATGTLTVTTVNAAAPGSTATGAQTFNDAVLLRQATSLTSAFKAPATTGGAITFNQSVGTDAGLAPMDLTLTAGIGQTMFASGTTVNVGRLDAGGAQVTFNGSVGTPVALGTLTIRGNGSLPGNVVGSIDVNTSISSATGQNYVDPILLSEDVTLADSGNQRHRFPEDGQQPARRPFLADAEPGGGQRGDVPRPRRCRGRPVVADRERRDCFQRR